MWTSKPIKFAVVTLLAAVAGAAGGLAGSASAATPNRRPICNNVDFTMPVGGGGGKVFIPVLDFAADPDVTPVRLISVLDIGTHMGTATIVPGGILYTLTNPTVGIVDLEWTVTDGSLQASCDALMFNEPPVDNG
jgi:hypothetical protein